MLFRVLSAVLAAITLGVAGAAAAPVRVVEFEQRGDLDRYRVQEMVPLQPGDEYSPALVERSRRLLEATGLFRLIEVETEEMDEGWRVTFRVVPYEFVDDVSVTGNFLILKKDLRRALSLRPGDRFSEERAREDAAALLRIYEGQGYGGTQVRTEVERRRRGVSVVYRIREGRPGVVRKIELAGNDSFPDGELTSLLRLSLLGFFDQERLVDSVERLERHYREQGFLDVTVRAEAVRGAGVAAPALTITNPVKALAALLPGQYEVVDITFLIEEGQRYTVVVEGNQSYTDEDLRGLLTFAETGFFDEHEAEAGRRRMLDFYHSRGYYLAGILLEHDPEERRVVYRVSEGRKFTVGGVSFSGVQFFSSEDLFSKLRTRKGEGIGEAPLRRDYLEEDRRNIQNEYRFEGFLDAEVLPAEVVLGEVPGMADVTFTVREGERRILGRVAFEGVTVVDEEELREVLKSRAGNPYRPGEVTSDKERILALVSAEGFPDSRVREKVLIDNSGKVDLLFLVHEGKKRTVGKLLVVGGRKTRGRVVLREFPLAPGDPYSLAALVEGKRNLYGLGFFREVRVEAPAAVQEGGEQDLVIQIRERPTGLFRIGGGLNSEERVGGFVEIGEQNLFGTGRGVSLRAKVSTIERRYDFFLREPWPFGYQINSEANVFEEFREEKGYDTTRRGVNVGVKRDFLDHFTLNLRYRFEFVDYENVELTFDDPEKVAEEVEPLERINISSVIALLGYDLRDDAVKPHRGSHHLAGVEVAAPALGGNTTFNKYTVETSWYIPVTARSEFALGFRGGFAQTLAGFDELPLSERFFLGGARGVRGYPEREVGPKDSVGNPIGGDAFALGIAEYRFPLGRKSWRGVLFFDVGNVWANLEGVEPTEAKASVGMGLRYNTLVGPLRLDYGIKLNPEVGESQGRLHFNIGFPI